MLARFLLIGLSLIWLTALPQHPSASAGTPSAIALKAFDTVCVSTLLNEKRFRANVSMFKAVEIPRANLALATEADLGFVLQVDNSFVMASMGVKRTTKLNSRNCTVTVPNLSLGEARRMLETSFRVTRRDQFRQGLSELVMYSAELVGFAKSMAISVQHSADAAMTSVSLFEAE